MFTVATPSAESETTDTRLLVLSSVPSADHILILAADETNLGPLSLFILTCRTL
jgi:hypothetical protein